MPTYDTLRSSPAGRRTAGRLLALRAKLDAEIPQRTIASNVLLATWNIRELDSAAYGIRSDECLFYIAEIITRFDVVAVQEVREDLTALRRILAILGPAWRWILTDVTEGARGNRERMAFLYDSRKVTFDGTAGEVVIPSRVNGNRYRPSDQLARTPFLCGFEVGAFRFCLCTVHIYYGEGRADRNREKEIELIAAHLARRAKDPTDWGDRVILLGDFNNFSPDGVTFQALTRHGFAVPKELQSLPSNAAKNRYYDQIAFLKRSEAILTTGRAGVFDFFEVVYRDEDEKLYAREMGSAYRQSANKASYYRSKWRTHQMSDHLPMWLELRADFSAELLAARADR